MQRKSKHFVNINKEKGRKEEFQYSQEIVFFKIKTAKNNWSTNFKCKAGQTNIDQAFFNVSLKTPYLHVPEVD